jgi:hypothetical protein
VRVGAQVFGSVHASSSDSPARMEPRRLSGCSVARRIRSAPSGPLRLARRASKSRRSAPARHAPPGSPGIAPGHAPPEPGRISRGS